MTAIKYILLFGAGLIGYVIFLLVVFQLSKIIGYGFRLGTKRCDRNHLGDRDEDQAST
jgi:hypothetical protein